MVKKEMFAVKIITKYGEEEYELANFSEMAADTARRVYFEKFGKEANRVVSMEKVGTIKVDQIPKSYTTSWAKGAKTIPVYYFRVD